MWVLPVLPCASDCLLAKTVGEWVITGNERMKERPIKLLVDALNQLGGKIKYIERRLSALANLRKCLSRWRNSHGWRSEQPVCFCPDDDCTLYAKRAENQIRRKDHLLTLHQDDAKMMQNFGVKVDFEGQVIDIRPQSYQPIPYRIESDWSAASYWYEILAISGKGKIILKGLQQESMQGDSQVAEIFKELGVLTEYQTDGVKLTPTGNSCKMLTYDFVGQPDLCKP